jgi:aspartyl protease family protein
MKNRIRICVVSIALFISSSCSQSGKLKSNAEQPIDTNSTGEALPQKDNWKGKVVIKMEKKNGVYQVPIWVNDVKMHFIFDTGAGMVSISETEVNFLIKEGTLTQDDFIGSANFVDANGDVSEGSIINLKSIKVGNRTLYNIKASVVHNLNAPLLLGQTVLEQFGKISIDNKKGEITLE